MNKTEQLYDQLVVSTPIELSHLSQMPESEPNIKAKIEPEYDDVLQTNLSVFHRVFDAFGWHFLNTFKNLLNRLFVCINLF